MVRGSTKIRLFAAIAALLTLLVLAACSSKSDAPTNAAAGTVAASPDAGSGGSAEASAAPPASTEPSASAEAPAAAPSWPDASGGEAAASPQHSAEGHSPAASAKPSGPAATPKPEPSPMPMPTSDDASASPAASASAEPVGGSASPSASAETPQDLVTVEIKNYAFSPDSITVKVGGQIEFVNRDDVAHSAVADDNSFDTGLIDTDKSATVTFDKAGTYTFHCGPHPFMTATVVVESP